MNNNPTKKSRSKKKYYIGVFEKGELIRVVRSYSEKTQTAQLNDYESQGYSVERGYIHTDKETEKLFWLKKGSKENRKKGYVRTFIDPDIITSH